MLDIETATWVETRTMYGEHPHTIRTETWIRIDPPAKAWRNHHGPDSWSFDILDERGHLHTASSWGNCVIYPSPRQLTSEELRREVCLTRRAVANEQDVESGDSDTGWLVEETELADKVVRRYSKEYVQGNFGVSVALYVDPETNRYVRVERSETSLPTGEKVSEEVRDQYCYNIDLPPDTFEMPPGKPVEKADTRDVMPEVWDTLREADRQAIKGCIATLDAGWSEGNFPRFASAWRFDKAAKARNQREWRSLVEDQRGRWKAWSSEVKSVTRQDFVPIAIGVSTFSMVSSRKKTLAATVDLRVVWAEDGDEWEGEAKVFLQSSGGQLRIVHWECPIEQIKADHLARRCD
jgi:hypothetical protein